MKPIAWTVLVSGLFMLMFMTKLLNNYEIWWISSLTYTSFCVWLIGSLLLAFAEIIRK